VSAVSKRAAEKSPPTRRDEFAPKRILVPTDFSQSADRALNYAVSIARLYNAEILVLHAFQLQEYVGLLSQKAQIDERTANEVLEIAKKQAVDSLAETVRRHADAEVAMKSDLVIGVPFDEIVEYAAQREVDLIVMPTHGRTGLAHFFLGSTTERVIERAGCPVLAIKETHQTA
jgi:nucleotide-binding universal stress UspA family protein